MMYLVPKQAPQTAVASAASPAPAPLEELLKKIPYKRIADQVRRFWGKEYCDEYLNSLLINDREGDRQGFSPEISQAIFALITLNELTRRRAGAIAEAVSVGGKDWANETGRWEIVKSPETKKSAAAAATTGAVPYDSQKG